MAGNHLAGDRERLRRTFDRAADRYHRARPGYLDHLFDDLVQLAGLRPGDRLLEVGGGTGKAMPGELPDDRTEIESTGLFDDVQVRHYDCEVQYDAKSYLDLLDTFSGHITMAPWKRTHLYDAIRGRLAERPDRPLRRHWGAVLNVAHRYPRSDAPGIGRCLA
jgi:hypothetical protein